MIRLSRRAQPEVLQTEWVNGLRKQAKDFFTKSAARRRQARFEFDDRLWGQLKPDLFKFQSGKCAYCERHMEILDSDLDHFRPKAAAKQDADSPPSSDHYWWLAYEWENILLACKTCNSLKRNFFPIEAAERSRPGALWPELDAERPLLLDPIHEDPTAFLRFSRDGSVASSDPKGEATIALFQLNRPALLAARRRAMEDQRRSGVRNVSTRADYVAARRAAFQTAAKAHVVSRARPKIKSAATAGPDPFQYIRAVEVKNFRAIDSAKVSIPLGSADEIGWKVLLGENAAGKSTVLKAIAMVLMGEEFVASLRLNPLDVLHRRKRGADVVQARNGYVKLMFDNGLENWFEFDRKGFRFRNGRRGLNGSIRAYGSMRLLPENEAETEPNGNSTGVTNLFNPRQTLVDAEKHLLALFTADNPRFHQFAKNLKALLRLDPAQEILPGADGRLRIHLNGIPVRIDELSDGYQSMFALGVDLMSGFPPGSEMEYAEGILLMDELGTHLHPRWRMEIVERIRGTFRKLQVIATTHEPLCLVGLKEKEVVLLQRGDDGKLALREEEDGTSIQGMRVDQILMSPFFGLHSTIDPKIEREFQAYYVLLGIPDQARTADQETRLADLRQSLSKHRTLGYTRRDQILYDMIDKFLAEERTKPRQQRQALKRKTMDNLRRLWTDVPRGAV